MARRHYKLPLSLADGILRANDVPADHRYRGLVRPNLAEILAVTGQEITGETELTSGEIDTLASEWGFDRAALDAADVPGLSEDYPNEPAGYTRFSEYDCSDVGSTVGNAVRAGGWSTLSFVDPDIPSVVNNAGVPHSDSPHAIRRNLPDLLTAGTGKWYALGWDGASGNYVEVYRSIWFRVGSGLIKPSNKVLRLLMFSLSNKQNGGAVHLYNNTTAVGAEVTEFRVIQCLDSLNQDTGELSSCHDHQPNIDTTHNVGVDQWHHFEGWYKANSVDDVANTTTGDGEYKIWIDGVLTHHRTGIGSDTYDDPTFPGSTVAFRGWADTRAFWEYRGHMIWSHAGQNDKSGSSDVDFGHIYLSTGDA